MVGTRNLNRSIPTRPDLGVWVFTEDAARPLRVCGSVADFLDHLCRVSRTQCCIPQILKGLAIPLELGRMLQVEMADEALHENHVRKIGTAEFQVIKVAVYGRVSTNLARDDL